jgi:secreted trypsin-like serine protease
MEFIPITETGAYKTLFRRRMMKCDNWLRTIAVMMMCFVTFGCGGGGSSSDKQDPCTALKIAGGEECEERPLEVSVVATNFGYCTGTFITKRHVLTAAHCIPSAGQEIVVATKGFSATTKTARVHPQYTPGISSEFDVAIVTINTDAPVGPAKIELSVTPKKGDTAVAYGYGLDQDGHDVIQRVQDGGHALKATDIEIGSVSDVSVDTISNGDGDTCSGDSGGPIVLKGTDQAYGIVALVRSGPDTCVPNIGLPGENTNLQVQSNLNFISSAAPGVQFN